MEPDREARLTTELYALADLGKSPGWLLLCRALRHDIDEDTRQLCECDPTNAVMIATLQERVRNARGLLEWVTVQADIRLAQLNKGKGE